MRLQEWIEWKITTAQINIIAGGRVNDEIIVAWNSGYKVALDDLKRNIYLDRISGVKSWED